MAIGLLPSGKATGSDPVITGSNPVSPTIKVGQKVFCRLLKNKLFSQ